jgi:hypothetical protein
MVSPDFDSDRTVAYRCAAPSTYSPPIAKSAVIDTDCPKLPYSAASGAVSVSAGSPRREAGDIPLAAQSSAAHQYIDPLPS